MLKIAFSVLVGFAFSGASAAPSTADVDEVFAKYRKAGGFQAKIKKTVAQEVLGTETAAQGRFYFGNGKVRLEMDEPENSTLVFDGKTVWMESRLDSETIEVTKIKSGSLKKSDSIWTALFDKETLAKAFKLKTVKRSGDMVVYTFAPKDIKKTEIRLLEVGLAEGEMKRVAYKDDRENRVRFDFEKLVKEPGRAELFAYKPPKGATVTEL